MIYWCSHEAIYGLLLHLYPAQFRDDFARELALAFRDLISTERSTAGRCACFARAAAGIFANAPKEHYHMLLSDLRFAVRSFARSPWFTLVALVTLALGIGVNSALFSVVKSVLIEDLPYRHPERLVRVWVSNPQQGFDHDVTSYPRFEDWKARSKTFEDFAGFYGARLALTGGQEPEQLEGASVTANFFRVMGVAPLLGRDFEPGEDQTGRSLAVELGYGFWRRQFGGDPAVIGKQLTLGGQSYTVIGVMPEYFQFPSPGLDVWKPLTIDDNTRRARSMYWLNVVGRVRDGLGLAQAQAEMDSISRALQKEYVSDRHLGVALVGLKDELTSPIRPALLILMGAVILVLLICCANIAGMLAVRAENRQRELSIRAALGAGRQRVVRQLLTESVLLFVAGGVCGIGIASLGLAWLLKLAPPELTQLQDTHLDLTVAALTLAVAAVSGLVFGLKPALGASRMQLADTLKAGGRGMAGKAGNPQLRRLLMAGEMAIATLLLAGAGLLLRSLQRIEGVAPGFDSHHVSIAQIELPAKKYADDARSVDFWNRLTAGLNETPGIQAAAISSMLLASLPNSNVFRIEGRVDPIYTPLTTDVVTPNFFPLMKIPLLHGRLFTEHDRAGAPAVALINATAAARYWPNGDAVGKRFSFEVGAPTAATQWITIVGVVADTRRAGVDKAVFTESYYPLGQGADSRMQVMMRSAQGTGAVRSALQAVLRGVDRDQPITRFRTLDSALGARMASRQFTTMLLSLFAGAALALAAVGLYGLISYLVSQRLREFGVRLALGARAGDVLGLLSRQILAMAAIGLPAGLIGAVLLSRTLESLLFGVGRFDPASYAMAAAGLLVVSVAAAVSPALRALRVDPAITLRAE